MLFVKKTLCIVSMLIVGALVLGCSDQSTSSSNPPQTIVEKDDDIVTNTLSLSYRAQNSLNGIQI